MTNNVVICGKTEFHFLSFIILFILSNVAQTIFFFSYLADCQDEHNLYMYTVFFILSSFFFFLSLQFFLLANSTDNKLIYDIFSENSFDISCNLHEVSEPVFWNNKKENTCISKCRLLKFLLSIKILNMSPKAVDN